MRKHTAILLLMIGASVARADSCWTPSTIGFASDNGDSVVRIQYGWPEALGPPPRQMQMPRKCVAEIARWNEKDRGYRFLRSVVLRNEIGPSTAVISNDARFLVTFDDFCESGMSENAVVIYDLEKGTVIACGIEDFLPKAVRESLHRTISHIDWRDAHPYLNDEDRKVWISPGDQSKADFSVVVDLSTNSITLWPPQPQ